MRASSSYGLSRNRRESCCQTRWAPDRQISVAGRARTAQKGELVPLMQFSRLANAVRYGWPQNMTASGVVMLVALQEPLQTGDLQIRDPNLVVRGRHHHDRSDQCGSAILDPPRRSDGLDRAEDLDDPFSFASTAEMARMPTRARVACSDAPLGSFM